MGRATRQAKPETLASAAHRAWLPFGAANRRQAAVVALVALGLLVAAPVGAATVLRLSPPVIELELPPGGLRSFPIRISNDGPEALPVSVSTAGVVLDADGSPMVAPPEGEWSCAPWIELDKTSLELAPGGSDQVFARLKVPYGTRGGRYAVVLFRTEMENRQEGRLQLKVSAATATVVLLRIGRTGYPKGAVTGLQVELNGEGKPQFVATFENTGDIHLRMRGFVTVKDASGRVVARLPLEVGTGTVLPGGKRQVSAVWERWERCPDGEYEADLRASFHGARGARRLMRFALSRES